MKAVALISGGLDSTLAAKIAQDLGLELLAFNMKSPFCLCDLRAGNGCIHGALSAAKRLGLKLVSVDVSNEILEIIRRPRFGYGSNMNPCIDCRILLFKKAKEYMRKEAASFIITGEVLGQRPMSQRIFTMRLIEREAGVEGFVVRPLCAKMLEPTIPEKSGWIDRERLLGISGRSRKPQIHLAKELGINDYPCPSGGCLLTDPGFSKRLKDLMHYTPDFSLNDINLLKLGRHFRISHNAKLIVGRNEGENEKIMNLAHEGDYIFLPQDVIGPTCMGRGDFNQDMLKLSCQIAARYCDLNGNITARIIYKRFPGEEEDVREVFVLGEKELYSYRI
ncbi:MAG: hypothetical protein NC923_06650 [Candidatus Omnitrophica bacterium]|nr:hypothetical protein [Candidatus Omnitrophota bacterium]